MVQTVDNAENLSPRPPIVAVLGHVDHGKTSLLDAIRKTNITEKEAGGITQHIGAYQVEVSGKGKTESGKITFIDTPGHEAFAKMRSRGAQIADVAILVIAATEGVKPQTEESIAHIKAAGVPIIVAMNKMDLPEANPDRVKQQLAKAQVLVENYGGDVVVVPVSAKTGLGIPQLLETIILVSKLKGVLGDPQAPFTGVVIEARLDKGRGPLSTIIVRNGTLSVGQTIYAETVEAKVRGMRSSSGEQVKTAPPSFPVEVMGWKSLPTVGAVVQSEAKTVAQDEVGRFQPKPFSLPPLVEVKKLKLILKADVSGSLEAIVESLPKDNIEIVQSGVGEISESDILMAKSTGSVVIGFNLRPNNMLVQLANTEKVRIKMYTIIYELIEEISEVVTILNTPEAAETILGEATILAEFSSEDWPVAGCHVDKGRVARNDGVKLIRKNEELARSRIKSIRRGKEDMPKVESGTECGVMFDKKLDFKIGDRIIAFKQKELLS